MAMSISSVAAWCLMAAQHPTIWISLIQVQSQRGLVGTAGGSVLARLSSFSLWEVSLEWSREAIQGHQPPERWHHSAEIVGNQMYIFGGIDSSGSLCAPDMYIVDLGNSPLSFVRACMWVSGY